ncbi:adenylate/guanylate cyclase domain-containing protein [Aestuariirhabdus litorea]|uniref:adenylate/guanylate cyclase domain-containing protein n=1 Tax=Aestuariirhabdus litorea TaxID=2528527 RepID=UPI000F623C07|nr:adenylate/guanylate cyclase domain-containing protein [Aestuariirhabdus litorea]RWW97968.1 adenylate/guanylate cyclase domain-containing protein [Endozoicomonadaceae bacterium GTF-13]
MSAAIYRQQQGSERLIAWVELAVVLTFLLLYLLTPKTFVAPELNVSFDASLWPQLLEAISREPVPWALGLYLVVTLGGLLQAYSERLLSWRSYSAIVLNFALLYGLIWSFHVQYQQPPAFYLKAPTLLYVFIFIAIRALRFEARYVLFAGGCAVVGWMLLVYYVLYASGGEMPLTRDYVHYLTSNSVLLGAEFDKMISMVIVTSILALAITRARALLFEAVVETKIATDLARFVPAEVARQVSRDDPDLEFGGGKVGEATILFSDIEGFTSLSEQTPPVDLIRRLNRYFSVLSGPIESRGGAINQFQGDAVLASFNMPIEDRNHAVNAIRAALEIQARLRTEDAALVTRIGINTGSVVGGLVGTPERLSYTVHGDTVNLAARLEQLNKEYGTCILLSEATRRQAEGVFDFVEVAEVMVRGRRGLTKLYTLAGEMEP